MFDYSSIKNRRATRTAKLDRARLIDAQRKEYAETQRRLQEGLQPRAVDPTSEAQLRDRLAEAKAHGLTFTPGHVPENWRELTFPELRDLAQSLEPDTTIRSCSQARAIVAAHAEGKL